MRTEDPAIVSAIAAGRLMTRNAIRVTARDRATGLDHTQGFWADRESLDLSVIDGTTGDTITETFIAAGGLIGVSDIPLTSDITIRKVTVTISPLSDEANQYLRGYDLRLAPIQAWRIVFDPATRLPVGVPRPRLVGIVEEAPITIPKVGGDAAKAALSCVSHTVELTRTNPDVRSDESQQRRNGDRLFQYVAVMGQLTIPWGAKS